MHLLALSGSLRAASLNTMALRALQSFAPAGVTISLYEEVGALPHFNFDVESAALPAIVAQLRQRVVEADGLIIACPEYAHGLPGAFKNALDWLVGSEDFSGKPVMLVSTSPRSIHAPAQLTEVLITMAARIVPEANVTVELRNADPSDPAIAEPLRAGLMRFVVACRSADAPTYRPSFRID